MHWEQVLQRIEAGEDATTEFKRGGDLAAIGKTVCAFSNTAGGLLVLGVTDDQRIVGAPGDPETLRERLTSFLQNGCSTPVSASMGCQQTATGSVHWIDVAMQRGFEPMRQDGRVWVRRGRSGWGASGDGFPACAGMDPVRPRSRRCRQGLPRMRRDGPPPSLSSPSTTRASPHARGWTRSAVRGRPVEEHARDCQGIRPVDPCEPYLSQGSRRPESTRGNQPRIRRPETDLPQGAAMIGTHDPRTGLITSAAFSPPPLPRVPALRAVSRPPLEEA